MEDEDDDIQLLRRAVISSIPEKNKDIRVIKTNQHQSRSGKSSQKSRSEKEKDKRKSSENYPDLRHKLSRNEREWELKKPSPSTSNYERKDGGKLSRIIVSKEVYKDDLQSKRSEKEELVNRSNVHVIHQRKSDQDSRYLEFSSEFKSRDEKTSDSGSGSNVNSGSESDMDSDYTIEVNSKHGSDNDDSDSVYSVEIKNIGGSDDEMSSSDQDDVKEKSVNNTRKVKVETVPLKSSRENGVPDRDDSKKENSKRNVLLKKQDVVHQNILKEDGKIKDEKYSLIESVKSKDGSKKDEGSEKGKLTSKMKAKENIGAKNVPERIVKKITENEAKKESVKKPSEDLKKETKRLSIQNKIPSEVPEINISNQKQQESKPGKFNEKNEEPLSILKGDSKVDDQKKLSIISKVKDGLLKNDSIKAKESKVKTVDLANEKKDSEAVKSIKENSDKTEKIISKSVDKPDIKHLNGNINDTEKKSAKEKMSSKISSRSRSQSESSESSCSTCSSSSGSDSQYSDSDSESSKSSDSDSESESSSAESSSSNSSESESESSSSDDNFKRKKRSDSKSRGSVSTKRERSRSPRRDKNRKYLSPLRTERRDWGRPMPGRERRNDRLRKRSRERFHERSRDRYTREDYRPRRRSRDRSYQRRSRRSRSAENYKKDFTSRSRYRSKERQNSYYRDDDRSAKGHNDKSQRRPDKPKKISDEGSRGRSNQLERKDSTKKDTEKRAESKDRNIKRKSSPIKKDMSIAKMKSRSRSRSKDKDHAPSHLKTKSEEQRSKPESERPKPEETKSIIPAKLSTEPDKDNEKKANDAKTDETQKSRKTEVNTEKKTTKNESEEAKTKQYEEDRTGKDNEKEKKIIMKEKNDRKQEKNEPQKKKDKPPPLMEITLTGLKRPLTGYDRHTRKVNVTKPNQLPSRTDKSLKHLQHNEADVKRIRKNDHESSSRRNSNENNAHVRRLSSGKTVLLERSQLQPLMKPMEFDFITSDQTTRVIERKEVDKNDRAVTRRIVTERKPKEQLSRSVVKVDDLKDSVDSQPPTKRKVFSRLGKQVLGKSKNISINLKVPVSKEKKEIESETNRKGEEDLDSRIQQIREKNEEILRRQKEIEEDIKVHAL